MSQLGDLLASGGRKPGLLLTPYRGGGGGRGRPQQNDLTPEVSRVEVDKPWLGMKLFLSLSVYQIEHLVLGEVI